MEAKPLFIQHFKNLLMSAVFLFSLNGFSQHTKINSNETSLQKVVDGIKQRNESIKNVDSINVMVNDMLIEDLRTFTLDPKWISMVEVLVLNPKPGSTSPINSIIINTK